MTERAVSQPGWAFGVASRFAPGSRYARRRGPVADVDEFLDRIVPNSPRLSSPGNGSGSELITAARGAPGWCSIRNAGAMIPNGKIGEIVDMLYTFRVR